MEKCNVNIKVEGNTPKCHALSSLIIVKVYNIFHIFFEGHASFKHHEHDMPVLSITSMTGEFNDNN